MATTENATHCGDCKTIECDSPVCKLGHVKLCPKHASVDALEARFRSLTPGGSEFQTPEECAAYIQQRWSETHNILVRMKREQAELRELLKALRPFVWLRPCYQVSAEDAAWRCAWCLGAVDGKDSGHESDCPYLLALGLIGKRLEGFNPFEPVAEPFSELSRAQAQAAITVAEPQPVQEGEHVR